MESGIDTMGAGDTKSARRHFETAVAEAEKFGHNNSNLAESLVKLAECIQTGGTGDGFDNLEDVDKCFECYERALGIFEVAHGPTDEKVANCLTSMGKLLMLFDPGESEKYLKRAISIYKERNLPAIAEPVGALATANIMRSRYEENERMLLELVEYFESSENSDSSPLAKTLIALADSLELEKEEESIHYFERALALLGENPDHADAIADASTKLGRLYFARERPAAAQKAFTRAVEIGECSPVVKDVVIEEALCRLARVFVFHHRDFDRAESLLKRAESMRDPSGLTPIGANIETEYGFMARFTKSKLDSYESSCRRRLEALRSELGEEDLFQYANFAIYNLIRVLIRKQSWNEVIELLEDLQDKYGNQERPSDHLMSREVVSDLALAYARQGRIEEARERATTTLAGLSAESYLFEIVNAIRLMHLVGMDSEIGSLIEIARQRIKKETEEFGNPEDGGRYFAVCVALLYAKQEKLAREMFDEGLAIDTGDSFFAAASYEEFAFELKEAGFPDLAAILEEEASRIREIVAKRERESLVSS